MSRDNRKPTQAREISIETNVNLHAEGSVLVKFGNTHVICTASIDNNVPRWMKGSDTVSYTHLTLPTTPYV